jgi:hypothetical protein
VRRGSLVIGNSSAVRDDPPRHPSIAATALLLCTWMYGLAVHGLRPLTKHQCSSSPRRSEDTAPSFEPVLSCYWPAEPQGRAIKASQAMTPWGLFAPFRRERFHGLAHTFYHCDCGANRQQLRWQGKHKPRVSISMVSLNKWTLTTTAGWRRSTRVQRRPVSLRRRRYSVLRLMPSRLAASDTFPPASASATRIISFVM